MSKEHYEKTLKDHVLPLASKCPDLEPPPLLSSAGRGGGDCICNFCVREQFNFSPPSSQKRPCCCSLPRFLKMRFVSDARFKWFFFFSGCKMRERRLRRELPPLSYGEKSQICKPSASSAAAATDKSRQRTKRQHRYLFFSVKQCYLFYFYFFTFRFTFTFSHYCIGVTFSSPM